MFRGKSLSVKAISALWGLPLFRLDMNKVYSDIYGTPEGTFARAIKNIEGVAPAILWIDEIEGGISSNTATANRIDLLPAEIFRSQSPEPINLLPKAFRFVCF